MNRRISILPALLALLGLLLFAPGVARAEGFAPQDDGPSWIERLAQRATQIVNNAPQTIRKAVSTGIQVTEVLINQGAALLGTETPPVVQATLAVAQSQLPAAAESVTQAVVDSPIGWWIRYQIAVVETVANGEAVDSLQGALETALTVITAGWYTPSGRPIFGNESAYEIGLYPGMVLGVALLALGGVLLYKGAAALGLARLIAALAEWVMARCTGLFLWLYLWLQALCGPQIQRVLQSMEVSLNKLIQAFNTGGWPMLKAELLFQLLKWWWLILAVLKQLYDHFTKRRPPLVGAVLGGSTVVAMAVILLPLVTGAWPGREGAAEPHVAAGSFAQPADVHPASVPEPMPTPAPDPSPTPVVSMTVDLQDPPVVTLTYRRPLSRIAVLPKDNGRGCFGPAIGRLDLNGNGVIDAWTVDSNGDGVADALFADADEDGYAEAVFFDEDLEGRYDCGYLDLDQDGRRDTYWRDRDGDGTPQDEELENLEDIIAQAGASDLGCNPCATPIPPASEDCQDCGADAPPTHTAPGECSACSDTVANPCAADCDDLRAASPDPCADCREQAPPLPTKPSQVRPDQPTATPAPTERATQSPEQPAPPERK